MSGAWEGGKGDATRPEAAPGNYSRGYDGIDWTAREKEKNRTMQPANDTIPVPYLSAHPTGSKYTVTPPVLTTDDDWLVLVPDLDEAVALLEAHPLWQPAAAIPYDIDGGLWRFRAYRGGPNVNLIVTDDKTMYLRSVGATLLAAKLNLQNKGDRVALFREIRFGDFEELADHPHYDGPLP